MINPYTILATSLTISLLIYQLNWSYLFADLNIFLLIFLLLIILSNLLFAGISFSLKLDRYRNIFPVINTKKLFIFVIFIWVVQFAYSGIPLLNILRGVYTDYRDFGIPTIKVFITTFSLFCSTYFFHLFLSSHKRKFLLYTSSILFLFLLAMSRGMFIFGLTQCLFLLLFKYKYFFLNSKKIILSLTFSVFLVYGFGYLGTVRQSAATYKANNLAYKYDTKLVNDIMRVTPIFEKYIPHEFIWVYIYVGSPLANLNHNMNNDNRSYSLSEGFLYLLVNEMSYDFISKRINHITNYKPPKENRVAYHLTVSTAFLGSYLHLGFGGILMFLIFILFLPLFFLQIIPKKSSFYLVVLAILNTMYLYMFFDNMISFSGESFQLVYPFVFSLLIKK